MMEHFAKQTKQPEARTRNHHFPSHSASRRAMLRPVLTTLALLTLLLLVVPAASQPVSAHTIVATVTVGSFPFGVAVNSSTNRIYVTNAMGNNVSVIDGATNTVVATVAVGNTPYQVDVNPSTNRIYVANSVSNNVSVIDGATNTVVATVAVGSQPLSVGVNTSTNRIYVSSWGSDNVSVIDGATDTVVATVDVGGPTRGMAVNSSTNRIYAGRNNNTVRVIDGATNTVVATVAVGSGQYYFDVNPSTNRIYNPNFDNDTVSVIDGATNTVVATVAVGDGPRDTAVNASTNRIYVANRNANTVSVIDGATNTVVNTVTVGNAPYSVAVNSSTNRIYVANSSGNTVSVLAYYNQPTAQVNTATGTGIATFTTSDGSISGLTASTSTPCGTLSGLGFPHGFFSFKITFLTPGATVTITITLPANMPANTQYWKCINGQWVDCSSLLGSNDGDNIITLTITDGGLGDADGQANGVIQDPGGPCIELILTIPAKPRASPSLPRQLKPAQMSVLYMSVSPQQAAANQLVTISTNVVNTGDEAGNLNVTLKINSQVEQTRMVSVGPQGTQPVKFTVTKAQPGTYTIDIGGQKGSFIVLGNGSTAHASVNGGLIVILLMGILILATVVVLVATRRRPA
jgi:YVTN family beta-propeller protein